MIQRIWPIVLVVFSNVLYQICAKNVPSSANPFASLIVTYLVGAAASAVMYFVLNRQGDLLKEFQNLNWATFVFGLVLVGLEAGWIYAYKAGWQVSTAAILQSTCLAVILIFVGALLYQERISWNKIVGVLICLIGLFFIKLK